MLKKITTQSDRVVIFFVFPNVLPDVSNHVRSYT